MITVKHLFNFYGVEQNITYAGLKNSKGESAPFANLLDAYKFGENYLNSYNVYVDGVAQSLEAGNKLMAEAKKDGSYYLNFSNSPNHISNIQVGIVEDATSNDTLANH